MVASFTTQSSGTFQFSNLPPGMYTLNVTLSGYQNNTTTDDLTAGSNDFFSFTEQPFYSGS